jgi:hypothetical protein
VKRVLLLLLALAVALALLALFARRSDSPRDSAASPGRTEGTPAQGERAVALDSEHAQREHESELSRPGEAITGEKGKVEGRVVFARTQTPVRGGDAQLWYTLPGGVQGQDGAHRGELDRRMVSAQIGGDGVFVSELPLSARLSRVQVSPSRYMFLQTNSSGSTVDRFVERQQPLDVEVDHDVVELLISVDAPVELNGIVRDAETLAPLAGARISTGEGAMFYSSTLSTRDGTFVLRDLLPDPRGRRQRLHVECQGYLTARCSLEADALAPGAPPVTVDLRRGLVVEGTVVDEQQQPVPGVMLNLLVAGFEGGLDSGARLLSDPSDGQGHFRCSSVAPCSSLSVDIEGGWHHSRDYLALHQDLGALQADRKDVQIQLQSSRMLELRALLADGTKLRPREFEVVCANAPGVEVSGYGPDGLFLRVPPSMDLELEVYASANDEHDSELFVRGSLPARVDSGGTRPPVLQVVLAERGVFKVPLPHIGTSEFVLPGPSFLHAATDVQVLDAGSGRPLSSELSAWMLASRTTPFSADLRYGWLRVRGRPGRHVFEVEIDGGTREVREVVIPASGYGTAEWRVKAGP